MAVKVVTNLVQLLFCGRPDTVLITLKAAAELYQRNLEVLAKENEEDPEKGLTTERVKDLEAAGVSMAAVIASGYEEEEEEEEESVIDTSAGDLVGVDGKPLTGAG